MKELLKAFAVLLTLNLFLTTVSLAQMYGSVSVSGGYSDNIFRSANSTDDGAGLASLSLGYEPGESWLVQYSGYGSLFQSNSDRNYTIHSLGAMFYTPLQDKDVTTLSLYAGASSRLDRSSYSYYDYTQWLGRVKVRHNFTPTAFLTGSYQLRQRRYPDFNDLSYVEQYASLAFSISFQTRTSVRLSMDYGLKNYSSLSVVAEDNTSGGGTPGGGNGHGGMGGGNNIGGGSHMEDGWNGMRRHYAGGSGDVHYLVYDNPSSSQAVLRFRVAQSLWENAGIRFQYEHRFNLADRGRSYIGSTVDYLGEEELFDDPYSYEGPGGQVAFTQLMPWSMKVVLSAEVYDKTYSYPVIAVDPDLQSEEERKDLEFLSWVRWEKGLPGFGMLERISISTTYFFIRNQSNTPFFDYHANSIQIGVRGDF
ncbi:MAG: hypothetical protein GXO82_02890 [Chlorobi bacterium]|nr:hypothetical protein [Chlorobiota bacterium]